MRDNIELKMVEVSDMERIKDIAKTYGYDISTVEFFNLPPSGRPISNVVINRGNDEQPTVNTLSDGTVLVGNLTIEDFIRRMKERIAFEKDAVEFARHLKSFILQHAAKSN